MAATRIATTAIRDLQVLGTGGQRTIDAADTLLALLTRELSPAHAAIFAEPQVDAARGVIDWYAEGSGPAEPLSTLPPDLAAAAQARLEALIHDIQGLIERLRQTRDESDRFLAEMLYRALHLPEADAIRVRNGAPVLVGWGHKRVGAAAPPVRLLGLARAPATPVPTATLPPPVRAGGGHPAASPVEEAARAPTTPMPMAILPPPVLPTSSGRSLLPFLLALAATLLLLGALWLCLPPSALIAFSGGSCAVGQGDLDAIGAWRETDARNAELRSQLAVLADDAGRRRLQCPPVRQAAASPQLPLQDARRAQQRGAGTGKLQIILAWDDGNDLDLHVLCPDNTHIFFGQRAGCGGELDLDANSNSGSTVNQPVEHIYWVNPPPGTYKVVVDPFGMRVGPRSSFRLTIRQEGQPDRVTVGVAEEGHRLAQVTEVHIALPSDEAPAP